jgi:hypothetical protein
MVLTDVMYRNRGTAERCNDGDGAMRNTYSRLVRRIAVHDQHWKARACVWVVAIQLRNRSDQIPPGYHSGAPRGGFNQCLHVLELYGEYDIT